MLLRDAGIPFTVVSSTGDEEVITTAVPHTLAVERARVKAAGAVLPPGATGLVLGADTVVALGDEMFEKPMDDTDAARILGRLSGSTHQVMTGHVAQRVINGRLDRSASLLATTAVTMRQWTADEIAAYIATGEHHGKAGAYAIQANADRFVTNLDGDFDTVVGLSVTAVVALWQDLMGTRLRS